MQLGQGWDSPALLQLIVHRPANAKEDGVRKVSYCLHPQYQGSQGFKNPLWMSAPN